MKIQPPAFVIALKDHSHSMKLLGDCMKSAELYDWKVEINWAVDGRSIKQRTWGEQGLPLPEYKKINNRPGIQGCFLSHWFLWKKCIELNQQIIILEHDAVIEMKWKKVDVLTHLTKLHTEFKVKRNKFTGNWGDSTHAYTLSPNQANMLIEFSIKNGPFPTDVLIGDNVVSWRCLENDNVVARNENRGISTTTFLEEAR